MNSHYPVSGNRREGYHLTDSGAYQLIMRLVRPAVITIGALGSHEFPLATYIYTGRASRGLKKRIERHLRNEKRLRWHIDYLLQQAHIEEIQEHGMETTTSIRKRLFKNLPKKS